MKKCQECNETRNAEELYDTKICEKCEHSDEFYKLNKKSLIPLGHRKKGLNLTMMIFHFYKLQMMMMIMNRTNPKSKGVV